MSGNGGATVQGYGQLLGQEKKAGVVYWEWYDEGSHRVGAAEVRDGERVHIELSGALGVKSFEITLSASMALVAALVQLMVQLMVAPPADSGTGL
jgi:hypothetical protein